jgi:hypothetical protein
MWLRSIVLVTLQEQQGNIHIFNGGKWKSCLFWLCSAVTLKLFWLCSALTFKLFGLSKHKDEKKMHSLTFCFDSIVHGVKESKN